MKRFTLNLENKSYQVYGNTLDSVWADSEFGMPDVWKDNIGKVIEEDINEQFNTNNEIEQAQRDLINIDSNNVTATNQLEVIKALVDKCKGDPRPLVKLLKKA